MTASSVTAALCVVSAIGIFSVIFTAGRFAGDLASALQIMFLRYLGGFATLLFVCWRAGETWQSIQSRHRVTQVLRVLAGGLGGAAIIYGNASMPLVDANAIGLLKAVFFVGLGVVVLGERPRPVHAAGILVCIAGAAVVMMSRGAFATVDVAYLVPAGVVLAGAFLVAVEALYIKILATADRPLVTLAHANGFGMILLLVPAVLTWRSTGPVNLAFLALGPLAIFAQYLNIRGYALTSVSVLAPLSYTSLIFAALLGWLFFSELPTAGVVAGALMITAGGVWLASVRR